MRFMIKFVGKLKHATICIVFYKLTKFFLTVKHNVIQKFIKNFNAFI